jgi:16S rRNA (cytidine1402-2'-O)-methyltransferase
VPTPIGNLGDITLRALEVLKSVNIVFSEDTRNTIKLLNYFGIKKRLVSYHKDNEAKSADQILSHVLSGESVALVSDAGTPCISDPGQIIINRLMEHNISFEVLPGATAFVPAVIKSGFPTDKIFFCGFLPVKNKDKKHFLEYLKKNVIATIVFYEAPHRLVDTLKELLSIFNPPISVSRELTKIHETTYLIKNIEDIENITEKGEFVLVVNNNLQKQVDEDFDLNLVVSELKKDGFDNQEILKILKVFGVKRNVAYRVVLGKD